MHPVMFQYDLVTSNQWHHLYSFSKISLVSFVICLELDVFDFHSNVSFKAH